MKNWLIIFCIFFLNSFCTLSNADTCPYVSQFTPDIPPAGWTLLQPAIFPGDKYQFVSATHSLNRTYYNLQVLCRYECIPNEVSCSPFTLLSNATYKWPLTNKAPWNMPPVWVNTLVCAPTNFNPQQCVFSNIPHDTVAIRWKKLEPWAAKAAFV